MSHLPLDARAILEYLNELGYRNISAEQLKEFLKGMQPQPEFNSYKNKSSNSKGKTATSKNNNKLQQQSAAEEEEEQQQQLPEKPNRILRKTKHHHQQQQTINLRPRVIKSKQPLLNFRFYLDIRDHQLARQIEKEIKLLGGIQEFFLDANITHFITDKAELPANVFNNNNKTPQSPVTPQTPKQQNSVNEFIETKNAAAAASTTTTGSSHKVAQTRADAILRRVRLQGTPTATATVSSPIRQKINDINISDKTEVNYTIWQTEYALRFFKKVHHELKAYLQPENKINTNQRHKNLKGVQITTTTTNATTGTTTTLLPSDIITLKGGFIKIESIKRSCRPYYQAFRAPYLDWPKISLHSEEGAFCLTAEQPVAMTRKSRSRNSQCATPLEVAVPPIRKTTTTVAAATVTPTTTPLAVNKTQAQCRQIKESSDKQCGVCEICKIEYDTLTIHLKTKDHEYFAKNSQNFIALDTLIQSSADVNKFLAEQVEHTAMTKAETVIEEMEVEVAEEHMPQVHVDVVDPLEQTNLETNTFSPPLREKSKRSTKGKHSSEKFQYNKRQRTITPGKVATPAKSTTTPKTLQITPTKNANTRKKPNTNANLSSPVRPFPPPSSLYKVVETSQMEHTPRRAAAGARAAENVTASPSLIVKIKKVRNAALLRLNGEAESFMFPKTPQRRASSDLPTDIDRQSSSERLRTSIYSSSSLDSSSISDIVVNLESPEPIKKIKGAQIARNKKENVSKKKQSFQSTPIQPDVQLKRLRKSNTTKAKTKTKASHKKDSVVINELSPPSAAAAIVAATAKITLPAATRKSSRMATAIVSAATTSSRLLRAAAEVVKKSGRTIKPTKTSPLITTTKTAVNTDVETIETTTTNNRIRRCRLAANALVVKMEDGMGDSSAINTDQEEQHEHEHDIVVNENESIVNKRRTRNLLNLKNEITTTNEEINAQIVNNNNDDDDDDDDVDLDDDYDEDIDNDDKTDKDFKYKCRHNTRIKPRSRRGRRKKAIRRMCKKITNNNNSNNKKVDNAKLQQKVIKTTPYYDYTKSARIQEQNYAFERVPDTDLWYRVFSRQDNCEEVYFEYFANTKYHKLPYELGPIPYHHTKMSANNCKLCELLKSCEKSKQPAAEYDKNISIKTETTTTAAATDNLPSTTTTSTPYTLKHKKLHLLQRYRQEQEALQQKQQEKEKLKQQENCQIKAENLANGIQSDMERRERAGSTHSTSSSCASSNTTMPNTKKTAFRTKLLAKTALLNLELPPRKSPREHASTLALVSIIKQRQESKSNSDAEELAHSLPSTPTPKEELQTATPTLPSAAHNTRSAAATPIEEMCFATEISENVKRMRRGRNKYDHSPPYVVNKSRRLARQKLLNTEKLPETTAEQSKKPAPAEVLPVIFAQSKPTTSTAAIASILHSKNINLPPSVRKTGQKKGVLEFAVDESALKALDVALQRTPSVLQKEREIDDFLTNTGKDYDMDELLLLGKDDFKETLVEHAIESECKEQEQHTMELFMNTPPATDYFSSDFDLCDLLQEAQNTILGGEEAQKRSRESKHISLYNTVALNKYFRKRKYMKSNRTGWPKLQKKKYSMRHLTLIANEQKKKIEPAAKTSITPPDSEGDAAKMTKDSEVEDVEHAVVKLEGDAEAEEEEEELKIETEQQSIKEPEESDDDTFYEGAGSIPEEEDADTVADSVADEQDEEDEDETHTKVATEQLEEYEKAVEADDEDELNDALEPELDDNTMPVKKPVEHMLMNNEEQQTYIDAELADEEDYEPQMKRCRRQSSLGKALANCLNPLDNEKQIEEDEEDMEEDANSMTATTSTPTKNLSRALRCTPQLNGSLLSCHSPTERAGDNSDIFTVSSDGLDTDLDLSNPHAYSKQEEQSHNITCNNRTNTSKTNKYDISKYVKNPAANTCAAEAATAAAKSLAIAQFLKKEVRVTCRRIRAPFRRFRYRR